MRFDEFRWEPDDIITHDKIINFIQDNSGSIVYLKGDVLTFGQALPEWRNETPHPLTGYPPRQRVWVTGNSDYTIDTILLKPVKQHFDAVFSVNLEAEDISNAYIFPIGLTHSFETLYKTFQQPREITNDVFLSFNIDTNIGHRFVVDTMFREESWVTHAYPLPMDLYYKNIRNHKFVFCPRGNGYDTHRMWETLYCGSIPICVSNPVVDYFAQHLPICVVKSWNHVTPEFLEIEYERIMSCDTWNMDMLKIGWWQKKILSHVKSECVQD